MENLKDIVNSAKKALELLENGKTYTASYVNQRFVEAAESLPGDQLISHMRDVISKAAASNDYITQSQIGSLYDEMYGLSGGRTSFRDVLGDLLPENHNVVSMQSSDYSE